MMGLELLWLGVVVGGSLVTVWLGWPQLRTALLDFLLPWLESRWSPSAIQPLRELVAFVDDAAAFTLDGARHVASYARRLLCLDIIYRRLNGNRLQRTVVSRVDNGQQIERTITREILSLDELSPEDRRLVEKLADGQTLSLAPCLRERTEQALQQRDALVLS
ncbi:MAG: hypothetical protein U0935_02245 [Pirellulales bacterium]